MPTFPFWFLIPIAMANEPCPTDRPEHIIKTAVRDLKSGDLKTHPYCVNEPIAEPWTGYFKALSGAIHLQKSQAPDAVQDLQSALSKPMLLGPLRSQTQLRLAVALHQIEDDVGALETLSSLLAGELKRPGRLPKPGGVDPGEVRWRMAAVQGSLQQPDEERQTLEALWTHNPTSAYAKRAHSRLEQLGKTINPNEPRGQALYAKRIKTLESLYRTKEALALREQLPKTHPLQRARAFAGAVFKAKDYHRAATLLLDLPQITDDERVLLALARVRSGDADGSIKVYEHLANGNGSKAELASYKLGYMAWDQGDMGPAIHLFKRYMEQYPSGKYSDTALWFTGMAHLRLGETAAAKKTFKKLEVSHPVSSLRPGAVYWQAMTATSDEQRTLLNKVRKLWPKTGYAWFASKALALPYPSKTSDWSAKNVVTINSPDWDLGTALSRAGLDSWARPHLNRIASNPSNLSKAQRIALANELIGAGSYKSAKRLVRNWCGNPAKATDADLIQACWPKPHGATVQDMATRAGLPPYLPFAIMTAESALDPSVTSPAGARGLMQLMPFLAEELHTDLWPDLPFDADEMYSANYNATLGTTELIRLAEQFSGIGIEPLPMVIAGYNGGAEAVGRWIDSYQAGPASDLSNWDNRPIPDLWAEFIGYSETRKYVRRVLGYLQTYRLAYGDPPVQADDTSKSNDEGINANGSTGAK